MHLSGKVVRKYGADGRTKLFTSPRRVVQNVNLDLVVVDIIDKEFRTNVIGVSVNGRSRFTYTGQASLMKALEANDVCCDRHGRIMLADFTIRLRTRAEFGWPVPPVPTHTTGRTMGAAVTRSP